MEVRGDLGCYPVEGGGWRAAIWAPRAERVEVAFVGGAVVPLHRDERGYFTGALGPHGPGERYWIHLDGDACADPASRAQPLGVLGPSALVDPRRFTWTDEGFAPPDPAELVIYELHVGTFAASADAGAPGGRRPGTFATAAAHLDALAELGITAVEPMPIAAFPGERNWGYDGVFLFAPQASYGGPEGFATFVDRAHSAGIAVILDVVYNHLGPEGSVHERFGPYTSRQYATPWGPAVNVDREGSDEVRRHFLENARQWLVDYHVDGLRLDAVHGIIDTSAYPVLGELADHVARWSAEEGRQMLLIAESDDNNPRVLAATNDHGYGADAQWADDFHHALHVALTGEEDRYYADFTGTPELARAIEGGFAYTGQYSAYRGRRHGADPAPAEPVRFVVCAQNHDQVGNRPGADRLTALVERPALLLAAGIVLTAPEIPLLFMGEEHGERAPFAYFVDHGDPDLLEAVRRGRAEEMGAAGSADPGAPETFAASCVELGGGDRELWTWYRALLDFRRRTPVVTDPGAETDASGEGGVLVVVRRGVQAVWCVGNTTGKDVRVAVPQGRWRRVLTSGDPMYGGGGSSSPGDAEGSSLIEVGPLEFVVYCKEMHG